jgi:hypothetical protein
MAYLQVTTKACPESPAGVSPSANQNRLSPLVLTAKELKPRLPFLGFSALDLKSKQPAAQLDHII